MMELQTSLSKALFSILKTSTCCSILALSSSGNFFMASLALVIPEETISSDLARYEEYSKILFIVSSDSLI